MSVRSQHHIGGDPDPGAGHRIQHEAFGDIRDLIEALPEHAGGTGYRLSDIFTEKHKWLRENVPDARSVFEFGALCGYFLVTACDACRWIERVGWCDSELHTPGSHEMVVRNLRWQWAMGAEERRERDVPVMRYVSSVGQLASTRYAQDRPSASSYDVVHVDGEHTYRAALIDLTLALAMRPRAILVDDSHAIGEVKSAIEDFCSYLELEPEWFETVNGFAVIRP